MTTPNDILIRIANGRANAATEAVSALSDTLAEVEEMVRELRPTEPVTIERGNTADLADLAEMRSILDGAGYATTSDGLRNLLERYKDRRGDISDLERERDAVDDIVARLRAQIAALTPGPWTRLGDMAPNIGETVLMHTGVVGTSPWVQFVSETTTQCVSADYLWRRLPAGLLDVPAPAVAPTNAQPEGAR